MMFALLVVSLVLAADAASLRERRSGRIVGGHDAEIEDYPYQVSLQIFGEHWCGGSIISKDYVLTAAHCVDEPVSEYRVRSGSAYHAAKGRINKVSKIILHSEESDIAIVKVKPSFVFDETRQPIKLADQRPKSSSLANVTGWGDTLQESEPDKLQAVQVPIISEQDCNEAYDQEISEGEVCAGYLGEGGKDSCQGDSGGPLAVNGQLVGVVSWGYGCAEPEYPGVYVNVAHYRDWIKKKTGV